MDLTDEQLAQALAFITALPEEHGCRLVSYCALGEACMPDATDALEASSELVYRLVSERKLSIVGTTFVRTIVAFARAGHAEHASFTIKFR